MARLRGARSGGIGGVTQSHQRAGPRGEPRGGGATRTATTGRGHAVPRRSEVSGEGAEFSHPAPQFSFPDACSRKIVSGTRGFY